MLASSIPQAIKAASTAAVMAINQIRPGRIIGREENPLAIVSDLATIFLTVDVVGVMKRRESGNYS